jgi:hypothetical protein
MPVSISATIAPESGAWAAVVGFPGVVVGEHPAIRPTHAPTAVATFNTAVVFTGLFSTSAGE